MSIKSIRLAWFRGAAEPVALDANCKSVVVYGQNGAGKSSFVDAVEYLLRNGSIDHLAHEYSGKRQEHGVPNTHTPEGQATEFSIAFAKDSDVNVKIAASGAHTKSGAAVAETDAWEYRRTVLRQDEVADFIKSPKGEKYSALLPLFGLGELEIAAENLRQLSKTVEQESGLKKKEGQLQQAVLRRKQDLEGDTDDVVEAKVAELHARYCASAEAASALDQCKNISEALAVRIGQLEGDDRRHVALGTIAGAHISEAISGVRDANANLADAVEVTADQLEVLRRADAFAERLEDGGKVDCPACGRAIPVAQFKEHLKSERLRLQEINSVYDKRKASIARLVDEVKLIKSILAKTEVKDWWEAQRQEPLKAAAAWLETYDPETLRERLGEDDLSRIEEHCLPILAAAQRDSEHAPPSAKDLSSDKAFTEASECVLGVKPLQAEIEKIKRIVAFINALQAGVRAEIRERSESVIKEISEDIRAMWQTLHPGQLIDEVRLYLPEDDKAIDIALRFHGKEQDSPRLTLSEGYRNSLGLCIFLALAKRDASKDRPLFLDDVVVSLDRNHRGMIVELLEKEFHDRQVILLTHDRDWFAELRQQLDEKRWAFKMLLPYESPLLGIRWSHRTTSFDDARAHLAARPDSAGNDARKIMDVELAIAAEKLKIRLPYVRGDRNDKRMAHDFLERLKADGDKCLQRRNKPGEAYERHTDALSTLDEAHRLLGSWGNKASHTFDLVKAEATRLIETCERALETFRCSTCKKPVWFADAQGAEQVQCECGQLRWRYGKG